MKLFVWELVARVSDRHHDEGGLVVVAESLEQARTLLPSGDCGAHAEAPDFTFDLASAAEPRCIVFPDAGCC